MSTDIRALPKTRHRQETLIREITMQIKSILAAAAIALAASVGSASAAEQFATLDGIETEPMAPNELGAIFGSAMPETIHINTETGDVSFTTVHRGEPNAPGPPPGVYVDGDDVSGG